MKVTRRGFIGSTAGAMLVAVVPRKVQVGDEELATYYLQLEGSRLHKANYLVQRAYDAVTSERGLKGLIVFRDCQSMNEALSLLNQKHEERRLEFSSDTMYFKNSSTMHFVCGARIMERIRAREYDAAWIYAPDKVQLQEIVARVRRGKMKVEWTI